ncbi:MAG: hypothetical protein U9R44_04120 [Candidatus Omnitrophota bacterium]|nr:hypothetical protein [Candidatus Omnitrophota bacterium]
MNVKTGTWNLHKDFIASHMRAQMSVLSAMISSLEDTNYIDRDYLEAALKQLGRDIKQLRRFISD